MFTIKKYISILHFKAILLFHNRIFTELYFLFSLKPVYLCVSISFVRVHNRPFYPHFHDIVIFACASRVEFSFMNWIFVVVESSFQRRCESTFEIFWSLDDRAAKSISVWCPKGLRWLTMVFNFSFELLFIFNEKVSKCRIDLDANTSYNANALNLSSLKF